MKYEVTLVGIAEQNVKMINQAKLPFYGEGLELYYAT